MKYFLFFFISITSYSQEKADIFIKNLKNDYLEITIKNFNLNSEFFWENEFKHNYDFYLYEDYEKTEELNKFNENKFYILIQYYKKKPKLNFYSISNEVFEHTNAYQNIESFSNNTFKLPLEQYTASYNYENYHKIGTRFFNYIELQKNANYNVKVYYKYRVNNKQKILISNSINIET
ncbi:MULTISPECIES: hypothetical protein [Weeksellaceae]|uniref:hypothetical protein n=1 Tax=Weeksellaceae TaxID=2762318 RepID=UPI002FCA6F3A